MRPSGRRCSRTLSGWCRRRSRRRAASATWSVRDRDTGQFVRVARGHATRLKPREEIIEVWEKDPSTTAFADLMNRTLDKPKEQEQEVKVTGDLQVVIERLTAARKRVAEGSA